jgi:hypothetical protein
MCVQVRLNFLESGSVSPSEGAENSHTLGALLVFE